MDAYLKLTLLKNREDQNGLAHQKKKDEASYDCDSTTRNWDVTTDHLDDRREYCRCLLEQFNNTSHDRSKSNFRRRHNQENSALTPKEHEKLIICCIRNQENKK